jgi:hypothetical protein
MKPRTPAGRSRGAGMPASAADTGSGQGGVGGQYLLVKLPELGSWFGADLVDEHLPRVPEGGERFGLAAVAVQGEHQQAAQVLA